MITSLALISVLACASCIPGGFVYWLAQRLNPEKKEVLRWMKLIMLAQFVVSLAALIIQSRPDPVGGDDYRGIFVFAASFVGFSLLHIVLLIFTRNEKTA